MYVTGLRQGFISDDSNVLVKNILNKMLYICTDHDYFAAILLVRKVTSTVKEFEQSLFCAKIVAPARSIVERPCWIIWRETVQNYPRYRVEGCWRGGGASVNTVGY